MIRKKVIRVLLDSGSDGETLIPQEGNHQTSLLLILSLGRRHVHAYAPSCPHCEAPNGRVMIGTGNLRQQSFADTLSDDAPEKHEHSQAWPLSFVPLSSELAAAPPLRHPSADARPALCRRCNWALVKITPSDLWCWSLRRDSRLY